MKNAELVLCANGQTREDYIYPATLLCDFYKISHRVQYPKETECVYATWIPRTSRVDGIDSAVTFGFQAFILEYLIIYFKKNFFERPKADIIKEYTRFIKYTLSVAEPYTKHLEDLHDLGYIPIKMKALPEGTLCPLRVPMMTIENTDKRFYWLTNYLETLASCELWQGITSATTAREYKKILERYAMETVGDTDFVKFQGHDFSMRGMGGLFAATRSGMGHLFSFVGTDTCPGIFGAERFYGADISKELIGTSINATEHAVMCANGRDQFKTFKYLLSDVYPDGFLSAVSDTWSLREVVMEVLVALREVIMARNGKLVIRPDSGDPVLIVCGDPNGKTEFQRKGVVESLWDIFGGTITAKGYKLLDSHIGCIYGDAITLKRAEEIGKRLKEKGFASINTVLGIGSYTYQYVTRDTLGFALKSTHVIVDGEEINIFKDPETDENKIKKSLTGRVAVVRNENDSIVVVEGLTKEQSDNYPGNLLRTIFENGELMVDESFTQIRERLASQV